jgi:bacillopeptidase F (M6 metalloprotease family)
VFLPVVLAAPPPPPPNPITNPDFEQGPTGWTQFSTNNFPLILDENDLLDVVPPHGGQWAAWLGGADDETSYLEQTVTVPAGAPYFTFWHWIASNDDCGWDFASVVVDSVEADVYDLCADNNTSGWKKHAADLSAYVGQSVAVQIRVETDESLNSNLFVDDVSFESQPPG